MYILFWFFLEIFYLDWVLFPGFMVVKVRLCVAAFCYFKTYILVSLVYCVELNFYILSVILGWAFNFLLDVWPAGF